MSRRSAVQVSEAPCQAHAGQQSVKTCMTGGNGAARSYTTAGFSPLGVVRNGLRQFRAVIRQKRDVEATCRQALDGLRDFQRSVKRLCGVELRGLKTLEIGHGQVQLAIAFVAALGNQCSGIDTDVTPRSLSDLSGYWELLRSNGLMRAAKTVCRELTGVNRSLRREFCRQMNLTAWPAYTLYRMDACNMSFADSSFDLVYSTDVLEHLSDPDKALGEILRVLKPGGVFWLRFLHWGHYNALHDLRTITSCGQGPPPWAHLVPSLRDQVRQGAYVNNLRIDDWRQLFQKVCPDAVIELEPLDQPHLAEQLVQLRCRHPELNAFSDEELLTNHVIAAGRKTGEHSAWN